MARVNLTDRFVASAKPMGERQTDYFDIVVRGLSLRVGVNGHKAWTFHFTAPRDGRRARVTLGSYPALSLASARTSALEARANVEDGSDPRAVLAARADGALTVADLVDSYLSKHVRPSLRTADAIERRLRKNVVTAIGRVLLADLHRRDVNRVVDPILARGSRVEAARVFEDLRACVRWAVARGDLDHNPIEGMRKPGVSPPRERVLSDDEIRQLWNGLPKSLACSKTCQRIVKLCLVTAQRVGEVAGMRRDELDLSARIWTLPPSRTKNESRHVVPLSDLAIGIIEEAMVDAGDSPFVFPVGEPPDEGPFSPHAVARTIGRAHERSEAHPHGRFGIAERWTAHDLRRSALTNLAKLGVPPVVAGAVANHLTATKAGVTLSVYTHYSYDREKREALNLWAKHLAAIVEGQAGEVVPLRGAGR